MVYSQKNIKKNIFERVFSKDVDSEELIWHRDKKNRIVEILEGDNWLLQMENELPKKLSVGQKIEIHKDHKLFGLTLVVNTLKKFGKRYKYFPCKSKR